LFKKEAMLDDKEPNADAAEYVTEFQRHVADWTSLSTMMTNDCVIVQKLIGITKNDS
jgi:hypothetical protein